MCIEHPDHTGSSANPTAPWNQPDAEPLRCDYCDFTVDLDAPGVFEGADCPECLEGTLGLDGPTEPDWDAMPGGHDDY